MLNVRFSSLSLSKFFFHGPVRRNKKRLFADGFCEKALLLRHRKLFQRRDAILSARAMMVRMGGFPRASGRRVASAT